MPALPRTLWIALMLQLAAQQFGGVWGAAIAGVITGLLVQSGRAILVAALSAALATTLLLVLTAVAGGKIVAFAGTIGSNFGLPGWGVLAATLLLPAIQAGGMAGFVSRVLALRRVRTSAP